MIKEKNRTAEVEFIPVDSAELIKEVCQLAEEIWKEHFISIIGEGQVKYMLEKFQSFDSIRNNIEKDGYRYFIMSAGNDNIGYTSIHSEKEAIFLSKLYIRKDMRGKGISRKAVDFIKNICRQEKLDSIWLTVNRNNADTINIYKRLGFEIEKTQVTDIGGGYVMDDYVMRLPMIYDMLLECAEQARLRAYAPYSHFRVGAALMTSENDIYIGCNVENASYSLCMCAERTSVFKAVADGIREFKMIAIVGGIEDTNEQCFPCGSCLQVLSEFCDKDFKVVLREGKKTRVYTLAELLPYTFRLEK